jgi:AcrR family transcriptional regulator
MGPTVKSPRAPRTRRAEQAEQTRRRILDAATALFTDPGYPATTIEAIAARADVAVETVYARFRSKPNLLSAILEPAIVGTDEAISLFDLPDVGEIRASSDQREQLRLLAHFSRTILERTAQIHHILHTAASADAKAAELQERDRQRRYEGQSAYIDMLLANGPLRDGLTPAQAADTYAALANPETFAFLTDERGLTPAQFEEWLCDALTRLLLDP